MNRFFAIFVVILIALMILVFAAISPKRPTVIVNMPADAKPLSVLETHGQVVGPDRAVLWFTVYDKTYACSGSEAAVRAADHAVMMVYGPATH